MTPHHAPSSLLAAPHSETAVPTCQWLSLHSERQEGQEIWCVTFQISVFRPEGSSERWDVALASCHQQLWKSAPSMSPLALLWQRITHLFIWRRKSGFQLLQKAKNRDQTPRNLRISTRGNSVGLTLNHHTSTSSSHGLITKPLSLLLPYSLLSFLHSVKLFMWLPHPHSLFQDFLSYFPSLSSKICQKQREIVSWRTPESALTFGQCSAATFMAFDTYVLEDFLL